MTREYSKESVIRSFFAKHGISPDQENSRSFIFDCPACEGTKKLYIDKKAGKAVCFKQGSSDCPRMGSQAPYALSLIAKIPLWQAKEEYYEDSGSFGEELDDKLDIDLGTEPKEAAIEPIKSEQYPRACFPIHDELSKDGIDYLKSRGLSVDTLDKYQIMYSADMRRVIFPVIMNGNVYGWQGRAVDQVDKKYRMYNLPGNWKARCLMFFDNLKNSQHAVLAEGPISAMKFEKVGGFVASMGKVISKGQLDLLINSGVNKVYMALDRDAFDMVSNIIQYISSKKHQMEFYEVSVPDHRDDFGDCTYDECEEAFKNARRVYADDLFVSTI